MLRIKSVSLRYGKQAVIRDLSLDIAVGTVCGLVGLNGSGKTTLINGLYGLKAMSSGEITLDDRPLTKKDLAYLETNNFFYSYISGREYLGLFKLQHPAFNIDGWNQLFDLPLDRYTEQYSTGMKKKLAFMGIVALDRPVLILDEPFNGIDLETTQKLKIIIKALRERGKTIILTSHILESLTSLCDSISYLENQRIQYTFDRSAFADMEGIIFKNFTAENERIVRKLMDE